MSVEDSRGWDNASFSGTPVGDCKYQGSGLPDLFRKEMVSRLGAMQFRHVS